jgi:hypothetical protein
LANLRLKLTVYWEDRPVEAVDNQIYELPVKYASLLTDSYGSYGYFGFDYSSYPNISNFAECVLAMNSV